MTCLHQAMLLEDVDAFTFLLQHGASIDIAAEGETVRETAEGLFHELIKKFE